MKTMNDYTIFCTAEQTKRALELGAPIEVRTETVGSPNIGFGFNRNTYIIPTAEQMIGLLERYYKFKVIAVDNSINSNWTYHFVTKNDEIFVHIGYRSRKTATLAAIDAALDFLADNKK